MEISVNWNKHCCFRLVVSAAVIRKGVVPSPSVDCSDNSSSNLTLVKANSNLPASTQSLTDLFTF